MIVSHSHKFIFIKTAKTAGTSLIIYLANQCAEGDLVTNLSRSGIDYEYGKELGYRIPHGFRTWLQSSKLSIWKYMVSHRSDWENPETSNHKMRKNLGAFTAKMFLGLDIWNSYYKFCFERNPFDKAVSLYYWHTRNLINRPEINEYILNSDRFKLSNWQFYTVDGKVAVDFVGQYENLDKDVAYIAKNLGFSEFSLPRAKAYTRTNHQHYSKLLSRESRKYIEKVCANEIDFFHYKWIGE